MKQHLPIFKSVTIAVLSMAFAACNLNIPPQDQYSDPDAITTVSNARSLLASAYLAYPHEEYAFSLLGNDFVPTSLSVKDISSLHLYNWDDREISKLAPTLWQGYYNVIAQCDALLERMQDVKTQGQTEATEKQAIIAEAKTLKALSYFQLLRVFAPAYDLNPDAPGIVLKTQLGIEDKPRASIRDVVAMIRHLLNEAVQTPHAPARNGWLSQTAVQYLLADVALYAGDNEAAITYGKSVLDKSNDAYFTPNVINSLWQSNSNPARIFAFNIHTAYYVDIQSSAREGDYFCLNPQLDYVASDVRRASFVYPFVMDGTGRTLFGKYNRANKTNQAIGYINMMRYAGTSNQVLLQLILTDKQREFAGEGINFFDLKRTHLAALSRQTQWGTGTNNTISTGDYRWCFPIPVSEYRFNRVEQNAGWPSN